MGAYRHRLVVATVICCVAALSMFGMIMLYSVTADMSGEYFLKKQAQWLLLGLLGAVVTYFTDYHFWTRHSRTILIVVSLPLVYLVGLHVLSVAGVPGSLLGQLPFARGAVKGAFRWLDVGGISVQPSEFAKLALILFVARYYELHPRPHQSGWTGFWVPMFWVGVVAGLILLGGSLSLTVITCTVVLGMVFVAGVRVRYLALCLAVGVVGVMAVAKISPVRAERLATFRDPERFEKEGGYQLWQSQKALGSGYYTGTGFNNSRMKEFYLPEAHTDFPLAVAGEELGFVCIAGVTVCYLVLVAAAFLLAAGAADRLGTLLGFGLGLSIGVHAFVNLGVVSGFLPTTGITAPLISYGGSGIVVTLAAIGMLLGIARQARLAVPQRGTDLDLVNPPAARAAEAAAGEAAAAPAAGVKPLPMYW